MTSWRPAVREGGSDEPPDQGRELHDHQAADPAEDLVPLVLHGGLALAHAVSPPVHRPVHIK